MSSTMRTVLAVAVFGVQSFAMLRAQWVSTGIDNEYTDGYWTVTLSNRTLVKVVAGGEATADLDLSSFAADTGISINRVAGSVCTSPLIASFTGPDVVHLDTKAFYKNTGITNLVLSADWHQGYGWSEQFLNGCSNLENLEPKEIRWTQWSGPNLMCNCPKLKVDLEFPVIDQRLNHRSLFTGTGLTSVSMPLFPGDSSFGEMFKNCTSLTNIYLPKAEVVGREFASGCTSLEEVYMPSCTNFGFTASFNNCSKLKKITIGKTLKMIPSSFMNGCSSLVDIEPFLPAGICDSGYNSGHFSWCGQGFKGCSSLEQPVVIDAPELRKLEYMLFWGCSKIADITLDTPALTNIDADVFRAIAPGAKIKWLSESAPETIASNAFYPSDRKNPTVILLRRRAAATAWRQHLTRVRVAHDGETPLTDSDRAAAAYPGKRTIGLIDANNNLAWVVRDWFEGTVIVIR